MPLSTPAIRADLAATTLAGTKPHYHVLDGLRGVAAITVVCFHLFEAYATSHLDQRINHGYLAVDFFFLLSGFVVGYAYDERWPRLTVAEFLKRRFIRLHPLVVIGALLGAALFYFQGCAAWDVSRVSGARLAGATLLNAALLPATPGGEIRGVGEMFPLNGPSWSLLFEYVGTLLYAFWLRRLATPLLALVVALAGGGLAAFAIWGPYGDVCVGFALTGDNVLGGFLRLLFSFSAGLLLFRVFRPVPVRGAFWLGSLVVVAVAAMPRLGGSQHLAWNGLYDTICCVVVFPLLVYCGASDRFIAPFTTRLCQWLGAISYPLYMVHYPFIYVYYAWVKNNNLTFAESLPGAAALVAGSLGLAYLCLKLYDEPVRRFLTKRLLPASR